MNGAGVERGVAGYDGRIPAAAGQPPVSVGRMLVESYTSDILSGGDRGKPLYNPVRLHPQTVTSVFQPLPDTQYLPR